MLRKITTMIHTAKCTLAAVIIVIEWVDAVAAVVFISISPRPISIISFIDLNNRNNFYKLPFHTVDWLNASSVAELYLLAAHQIITFQTLDVDVDQLTFKWKWK